MDRFFAQLRAWSEAHPRVGPVVRNAEELRRLAAEESASSTTVLATTAERADEKCNSISRQLAHSNGVVKSPWKGRPQRSNILQYASYIFL